MNNKLKPYAEYKKSQLPWAENIPKHWDVKRAKAVYEKVNRPVRQIDQVVTCFRDGRVTLRKNRRITGFTESIKEIGYQGVRKGDLVIHVMDAFAGAIGVSDSNGKSTPVYSICIPKADLNNYYYAHIVREMAKTGFIQSLYRGIRERSSDFRFEVFANQYLPILPRAEQDQIVKYLNFQLAKINKFIKAKKKLIAALKEQKQAIINQAVTNGISPNAKMKPSGIEWLGDIPEHWVRSRLGVLIDLLSGYAFPSLGFTQNDSDIRLLRGTNVAPGHIRWNEVVYWPQEYEHQIKGFELRAGDIVVGMDRPIISSGVRVSIIEERDLPCLLLQRVVRLRARSNLQQAFLYSLLRSKMFINYLQPLFSGISVPHISPNQIRGFQIALPPLVEQSEIVQWITSETGKITKAIKRIEDNIHLIQEYRTRLISDVVTGKVDVRGIVIDGIISEEVDMDENEDEIIENEGASECEECED